jgi:hypothetical protein
LLLRCCELTVGGAAVRAARRPRCSRCSPSSVLLQLITLLALLVGAAAVNHAAARCSSTLLQFGGGVINVG